MSRFNGQVAIVTGGALGIGGATARKLASEGAKVFIADIDDSSAASNVQSIKKTGKVIVAHEDCMFMGFGAEIVAQISEQCYEYLDGPVKRIGAKDSPIPYSPILEKEILPQIKDIVAMIKDLSKY